MKRNCAISDDLEEERFSMECGFTTVFQSNKVEVKQKAQIVNDVCGEIKLEGAPHYSLVLDTGSDIFPLVLVDSARHLPHWILSVGQRVVIKKLFSVCEIVQLLNGHNSVEHKNFMVKWEDVKILQEEIRSINYQDNNEIMETGENIIGPVETEHILDEQRTCRIVVHHVSIPFHVGQNTRGTCLVLISYWDSKAVETKLWLVLQNEQVAWREFLIANREYQLYFPPGKNRFLFDKTQRPLDKIMQENIRELRVIFHHKNLFSKRKPLNGSVVPAGSKLYLCSNSGLSELTYRFTTEILWFRFWFSTSEADHADVPFVTFYGKVTSVIYLEEQVYKSCYLCIQAEPKNPQVHTPSKSSLPQDWMDPFINSLLLEGKKLIELPNIIEDGNSRMKTGVPGRLVQVVKLEDLLTGEERSVYIKHSFVSSCCQMARLAPGLCVCLSHLNRRRTNNGHYYYIATMMTCCRVLDYAGGGRQTASTDGWGVYGFCQETNNPHLKTWGVLEPFDLNKVVIRAKCNYCGAVFCHRRCSNSCAGSGAYSLSTYAMASITIIQDSKSLTKENVLIKGNLVRKLLAIPERIWMMLEEAATKEEIVALRDETLNESSNTSALTRFFQIYFNIKANSEKFYISVKKLSSQDDGALYYCTNLEPITNERLHIVAGLVGKTIK